MLKSDMTIMTWLHPILNISGNIKSGLELGLVYKKSSFCNMNIELYAAECILNVLFSFEVNIYLIFCAIVICNTDFIL